MFRSILFATAVISTVVATTSTSISNGLRAQYFDNTALTVTSNSVLQTTSTLGYTVWPPLPTTTPFKWDYFSVEWTGSLLPPTTGLYHFTCTTADLPSLHLWIDDHLVCPEDQYTVKHLPLVAGVAYDLRAQYRHTNREDQSAVTVSWAWTATAGGTNHLVATPIDPQYTLPTAVLPISSLYRSALRDRQYHAGWGTYTDFDMLTHVYLPDAFSLQLGLWDGQTKQVLQGVFVTCNGRNGGNIRPGYHSWSGSVYTQAIVTFNELSLTVTTTVSDGDAHNDLQFLITPNNNNTINSRYALLVIPSFQWGRSAVIDVSGTSFPYVIASGVGMFETFTVYASTRPYSDVGIPPGTVNGQYLAFPLTNGEFTVSTGSVYTVDTVRATADAVLSSELASVEHFKSYGEDIYDSYLAMQGVLAWNTIYNPLEGTIAPVSKSTGWDFGGGYVLFGWDSYFASYMAAYAQNQAARDIAYNTLIQITKARSVNPDGSSFIPNYSSGSKKSRDRTEPLVGSKVVLELYHWYSDRWLLDLLYPDLLAWNTWQYNNRRQPPLGLITLGSTPSETQGDDTVNNLQAAKYESGLDNSPMYDEAAFDATTTHSMNLYDVGFASMYVMDCDALIELATILGKTSDVITLQLRRTTIATAIQQHHWNAAASVYQNVFTDTQQFSYHVSPTNFYPLLAGIPTEKQVDAMLSRWLQNATEMCLTGTCAGAGLPSITRSEPSFHEQSYWRGRIWGPQLQLMYWGLSHPAYASSVRVASARTVMLAQARAMLIHNFRAYGHVQENYGGDSGLGCDVDNADPFYHWGALTGFISILEYVGAPTSPPPSPLAASA